METTVGNSTEVAKGLIYMSTSIIVMPMQSMALGLAVYGLIVSLPGIVR